MDLRCPKCNSTDLKKVSLTYQEGLYRTDTQTRLRAAVVGGGGPDLVVARGTTRGTQESALSKELRPPVKWSYLKVVFWSALLFLCIGWLIFYINIVVTNSQAVFSNPLTVFSALSGCILVLLLLSVWRHNHSTYAKRYAHWDRSFICQRCGAISQIDLT